MNHHITHAFQMLSGITRRATEKEIKELEISINDKANEAVKEHLEQRKKELEKYLKIIIDYLEEV